MAWYNEKGNKTEVVVSSRARIARNISGYPFPSKMTKEQALSVINAVWEALKPISKDYTLFFMDKLSVKEKEALKEKHLISADLTRGPLPKAAAISHDETVSIMINEEDHIRIQCILPGLDTKNAFETADRIDTLLSEQINMAFSDDFGFLTSCPTNTGTGLRISAMLHLPALTESGSMNGLLSRAAKMGMTVRGMFGEGSEAYGNFYQLSNQITLGADEKEILNNFDAICDNVIAAESSLREKIKNASPSSLIDRLMRSYGIFKNAYMISTSELLKLISDVRFCMYLGISDKIPMELLVKIMVLGMPSNLMGAQPMSSEERDIKRAEFIKKEVK